MAVPVFSKKWPVHLPAGAQAGDLKMAPCIFRAKRGRFKTTNYAADYGILVVPENRQKQGSRLIALPVLRIRATGSDPLEPVFHLEGGPGGSNIEFVPPDWLLERHDFVLVGYRGADGSSILHCPHVKKATKGKGEDLLSKESLANIKDAVRQDASILIESGVDLAGYTILDVIEDIEQVRKRLGCQRINLLSESYGTRVAQIYAAMYPNSLFRSVMIGVNPPGRFVFEPGTIDEQLAYYAGLWAKDPSCVAKAPDLLAVMRKVSHNMPRRWLFVPIDPGKVKVGVFTLLYYRRSAAKVFDTFVAAERGDASGLALFSLVYNFFLPGMIVWGDMFSKGYADHDPKRDYGTSLNPPGSIMGSPHAHLLWGAAESWPGTLIPDEYRRVQHSSVETLLISGSIDFSTPAKYATEELLPYLSNGKQVIPKEFGHCEDIWEIQPEAIQRLLTSFYDTGVADDSLYKYEPMDFHVGFGFPKIAKCLFGGVILLTLAALALLGYIGFVAFW